jgi:hypothetical protein
MTQLPSRPEAGTLVERLREATTVLDEPFHHDAIAATLLEAADAIAEATTQEQALREELEKWKAHAFHGWRDISRFHRAILATQV